MLKTRAIQNLKDSVYDAINAGLFFDEIFQIIAKTLNSYNKENKDEYIKAHPLTDKFGVPIEIGDYVASGSGATIFKVSKLTPSTINYGISPKSCIIVRAKDPNKKLGW